jgi:hypothetical protein
LANYQFKKKEAFKKLHFLVLSQAYKPSSVENGHLSTPKVAIRLQRLHWGAAGNRFMPTINLAPDGVYIAAKSP